MKLYVVLALFICLTVSSAAQSLGANTFIFKAPNEFSYSYGYGVGFEYSYPLSKTFDLAVEPAFLYSSHNSKPGKSEYLHIPVLAGIRFYIFDYYLKPYISISAIGSYCKNDQIRETYIAPGFVAPVYRFDIVSSGSFNAGANFSFGTMLKVSDYLHINLNMGASFMSDRHADFSGFKLGAAYNLY